MGSIYFSIVRGVILLVTARTSLATLHIVGDTTGWTNGYDYEGWAAGKQFVAGDSLLFQYTVGEHNVLEVDETAYESCTVDPSSEVWTSGSDIITFSVPGYRWFVCGIGQHCANDNQKLFVNVQ